MFSSTQARAVAVALMALSALAASGAHSQVLPPTHDLVYPGAIRLHVDATDQDHKLLRVRETLPVSPGPLTLLYPQWIPGHHGPTAEVGRLAGLTITGAGKPLAWQRDPARLYGFKVDVPAGVAQIELRFQHVLAGDGKDGDVVLGRKIGNLDWHTVVLYPAGYAVSKIDVDASLRLPAQWRHASALRTTATPAGDELVFQRVSLETLVDSPVMSGRHGKTIDLDPGSAQPQTLHLFGDEPKLLEANDEQVQAHRKLVQQADLLFGARHFGHYDFLLALGNELPGIGLEHHQSSENALKAGYFTEWDKSASQRTLLPHEYSHSWNGKFRRPRDLWASDYNTATRNSLLWVYEGQTQYWGEVLAARSGLIGMEVMRERFARKAAWVQMPGRSWRSLQDTTFDGIVTGRKAPLDWYTWQRFEDYYDEGALIWLEVDTRIRELSGGQRSLDDFAAAFFGIAPGRIEPLLYDFDDVVAKLQAVAPYDWAAFLRARLDGVGPGAPLEGLARSGWRLAWSEQQSEYAKATDALYESDDFAHSLGFEVEKEGRIGEVVWDSPAFRAGLRKGLKLLAVDMRAYSAERLNDSLTAARQDTKPIALLLKEGDDYRLVDIDYHGGRRYPQLERIEGTPDRLTTILSAR